MRPFWSVVLSCAVFGLGCSSCDDEPARSPETSKPPFAPEPPETHEPPPDPCPGAEEALATFAEASTLPVDTLPTGSGGVAFDPAALRLSVGEDVRLGEQGLGPDVEAAVAALAHAELPESTTVALYLSAEDPMSRVAPDSGPP